MKTNNVVTLRMPAELKERLDLLAKREGVSVNKLANYLLNRDITEMEAQMSLERRLAKASVESLKKKARAVLDRVPARQVPSWDRAD